ncbi:AAA family ATPase [Mucilaginibacter gynuensis]|uniref:AAA family ATPase n=1 Tax=Mucilaginibacter gynuensis TaxID=1302236 RepID=A0ABP8GRD9_9SPHI
MAAYTLNPDQQAAFETIQEFLKHPTTNILVLRGYAGTGKTFLMQHLCNWLEKREQKFCMLASTGRAASVLKGKTGFTTKTVHSELYNFSKIDGIEENSKTDSKINSNGQMTLQFLLRAPDEDKKLYIVDEASMMSCEVSKDQAFATFGSGILLDDFFEVAGQNKIIFVGDPCQLPPVGQAFSPALDVNWLSAKGLTAMVVTLTKIERTNADNGILTLATSIRNMSTQDIPARFPQLPARDLNNIKLHFSDKDIFHHYVQKYKATGANKTLAIARSNALVQNINKAMRRELYGSVDAPLQEGDILLVTQNNYAVALTNGDFVEVLELGELKYRSHLVFQQVRIKALASDKETTMLLSMDALESPKGGLTNDQSQFLLMDFNKRMRAKNIAQNSEKYKKAMRDDEYMSSLKASYGYAVTCHKAQGGEWDDVYLFLESKMYGMPHNELCRWWYTAVTRAKKQLNLVNGSWVA